MSMLGENKMRQIVIVTAAVCIAVIVALFGATARVADVPQKAVAAATSGPIDIMQMMRDSKALPIEQFDAN
jgi:hypothetical protein